MKGKECFTRDEFMRKGLIDLFKDEISTKSLRFYEEISLINDFILLWISSSFLLSFNYEVNKTLG